MTKSKNIWIIGASSGIGEALARKLSNDGHNIAISARSEDKLNAILTSLHGKNNIAVKADVTDLTSIRDGLKAAISAFSRIDSVIFMAGSYTPMGFDNLDIKAAYQIIDTNLKGAINVIDAVIPHLKENGGGQLVLCGSVAGYRGLPNSQPYAATKSGIISLAESLKIEMEKHNIDVKVINPGFVETPMTAKNPFPMPMIIKSEDAASAIANGLKGSCFEIHFPKRFTFVMKLLKLLPFPIYKKIMQKTL
jgi:short-subunit dehydrogenase